MISPRPVRAIAVTGGKGGVGKTNVSVNLAVAMADNGSRVMLLDADLGLANVDVVTAQEADPVSMIAFEHVVATEGAIRKLEERLA